MPASDNEQRILHHALVSFATRGYAATGLRTIAADAALTAPMVNYYFKTKEALYQQVASSVMSRLTAAVSGVPDTASLLEVLTGNLLAHLRFAVDSPASVRFLFGQMFGPEEGRPPIDPAPYLAVETRLRQRLERAIRTGELTLRDGVTRADALELYQGLVVSLVMHDLKAPLHGKPTTEPRTASRRLAILLAGIGSLR